MAQEEVIFDDLNPPEAAITSGRACNVRYRLSANYVATSGDWVGLFRCTDDACELVGFEWAATDDPKDIGLRRRMLYFHADQIKRPLRATDDDFYHFAYVTRVGRIAGQSGHFRVRQGEDTMRSSAPTSLGPADVCYAARQCLANCRMLPVTDGRNKQALEKFKGVIEQMEMKKAKEACHAAWLNECDEEIPGKVIESLHRLRTHSPLKSDPRSGFALEATAQNRCHGCQMALRELQSLKHRLEMELNAGRITLEEMEEDMEVQRTERAAAQQTQQLMTINSKGKVTSAVKEEELRDVIDDLKVALEWSKERERCLQHQLSLERTLRMELIRSREDLESNRTMNGHSKQYDSHRIQVDVTDAPSSHTVTRDTKSVSNDSLEPPISRYVTEKDVRGRKVLVCTDCLQRNEEQKHQKQQQQQQQHPSMSSIDRPRRHKKPDETNIESGNAPAKSVALVPDRDTLLKEGQLTPEALLRPTVEDLDDLVVSLALQELDTTLNAQLCDTKRPQKASEVSREESAHKCLDFQPIGECLGEILALQAAVETSLSEINNTETVIADVVSEKPEVKGTGQTVCSARQETVSAAVGKNFDAERQLGLTYPEVVISTKEGRQSAVSKLNQERKSVDQKSCKSYSTGKSPVVIQHRPTTTDDQPTRVNISSRRPDRQQNPGNTTVIVKSRDSLTTYSGSNLSLWLLLGNNGEPERIVAKQTRKSGQRSQRPPRGHELLPETRYRGSSSSNAPTDTEWTPSGTNEVERRRNDEDERRLTALDAGRRPSPNANSDRLNGSRCRVDNSSADNTVTPLQVKDSFGQHRGPSAVRAVDTPTHQSPAVQQSTHQDASSISDRHQLALDVAALLSSNVTLTDSSSTPNQTDAYKSSRSNDNTYYHFLTSPHDCDVDDLLPIILAVPSSAVESISSALSAVVKEHSAPDFRFELTVPTHAYAAAQQSKKRDATCFDRATQADANQGTDASCSAECASSNRCTKSVSKVIGPEDEIKLEVYSGTLRSSPSNGTSNDAELVRRLSEMGASNNAELLEPEEATESPKSSQDPMFTSSSGFCFVSDETIRCLSGVLESAMDLTAALKLRDAFSPAPTAQPSEVTVTDTAKSAVYSEECALPRSSVVGHNLRQIQIIKPMVFGRGGRATDSAAAETKPCKGMNPRQTGTAFQNARIISDSIREYHRRMKASVEVPEESHNARKVVEQNSFPDAVKGSAKPDAAAESSEIDSIREENSIKLLPEETVSPAAAASSDPSSQSAQVMAPKVKASTTMTTESAAVTCCPKTSVQRPDSLDGRRCDCQAHRHPLPDEKHQDGPTEEGGSVKDPASAGPQEIPHSPDESALTTPSGDLSNDLYQPEADAAAGADGIASAVNGVAVESTGNDLELPPTDDHSTTTPGLEEIAPVIPGH